MRPWVITLVLCASYVACGYSTSIEGLYKVSTAIQADSNSTPFYMELAVSQYGPEVGGLVHTFSDKDYLTSLGTKKECRCMPLENAVVQDDIFMFSFELPGPCINLKYNTVVFLGYGFTANTKIMKGHIKWRDKNSADWHQLKDLFTLRQDKILKELTIEDKQCH